MNISHFFVSVVFVGISNITCNAEIFDGIEFPQGSTSFADRVVAYEPNFGGGNVPTHPNFIDPIDILGSPDYLGGAPGSRPPGTVALGSGGRITVEFHK